MIGRLLNSARLRHYASGRLQIAVLAFSLMCPALFAEEKLSEDGLIDIRAGTPGNLQALFEAAKLEKQYTLNVTYRNPWYIWGDFDGDGKPDYVVQLTSFANDAQETAVLFGNQRVHWLSRQKLNYPDGAWYVYPKQKVPRSGWEEKAPPVLKGDAIMMIKPESSAAIVFWTGKKFDSYFVSD